MKRRNLWKASLLILCASMVPLQAQVTYTTLAKFSCFYGECQPGLPISGMLEVSPGTFVGSLTFGALYSITSTGQFQVFYSLPGAYYDEARTPIQASDGYIYFPTAVAPTPAVFKLKLQGGTPEQINVPVLVGTSSLVQTKDLTIYGTSEPANDQSEVFTVSPVGQATVVASAPQFLNSILTLVPGSDGHLYGLTGSFTGTGRVSSLVRIGSFVIPLGFFPGASGQLIEASDGNFYGCNASSLFRLTKTGNYKVIYTFTGGADGGLVYGCGIQASDGNLYGTTHTGGAYGFGTIFRATLSGQVTPLYSFPGIDDQQSSSQFYGTLIQGSDGKIYGTTSGPFIGAPGEFIGGTIFSLDLGLPKPAPAITNSVPVFGSSGTSVTIAGKNFLGATSVSFNGTPAAFTVNAAGYIQATIPNGATTGLITVVTPNGTAVSPSRFWVTR